MPELADALARIPVLRDARPVQALGGGEASRSWRLAAPGGDFVLRADRPLARLLGLDRKREWDILVLAHKAGLGPEPVWADPGRGLLVTRWIAGRPWRPADLADHRRLAILGTLLRQVHAVPGAGQPFDPVRVAEGYARRAAVPDSAALAEVARLAAELYPADARTCLCHHDPNAENVIDDAPAILIDWEYAAAGQPLFDLAVVVRYHRLARRQARVLLTAWSGRPASEQFEELGAFGRLYDLLAALWAQVVSRPARG